METEEEVGHSENKRMEYKPCKVSAIQMAIIELLQGQQVKQYFQSWLGE